MCFKKPLTLARIQENPHARRNGPRSRLRSRRPRHLPGVHAERPPEQPVAQGGDEPVHLGALPRHHRGRVRRALGGGPVRSRRDRGQRRAHGLHHRGGARGARAGQGGGGGRRPHARHAGLGAGDAPPPLVGFHTFQSSVNVC